MQYVYRVSIFAIKNTLLPQSSNVHEHQVNNK